MSNTPKFEWNESLVREIVGIAHKDGYTSIQETDLDKLVEQFKQSKQPPLSKEQERITVEVVSGNNGKPSTVNTILSKVRIKNLPAIKQAIEAALNEDTVVYNQLGEKVTDYKEENVDRGMPITKTMNSVEAYNEGYIQGVKFCEKYGIPKHQIGAGKSTKPPLGLLPKHIWEEQRIWDIAAAIERYKEAGKEIPQEWINENYDLRKIPKPKIDTVVEDNPNKEYVPTDKEMILIKERRITELEKELKVTDELLNDRQRLLDAIPECEAHGKCVPHALDWIEIKKSKLYSEIEVDAIREETWLGCREFRDGTFIYDTNFKYRTLSDYLQSLTKDKEVDTLAQEQKEQLDIQKQVYGTGNDVMLVTDNSDVPILSLNDLLEVWGNNTLGQDMGITNDHYKTSPLYKEFEKKVNQKLKTHTP